MEFQKIENNKLQEDASLVERVFSNRGIHPSEIEHYLHTTEDDIKDPLLLDNIQEGAKMLIKHVSNNDNILIIVDSDADGFTSAALLYNYLYRIFPEYTKSKVYYRLHEGKQHGLNDQIDYIEKNKELFKLIVCPDSSSNDYECHDLIKNNWGIDILILDHHEASSVSKDACVINNQLCDYPTKSLSGVGIVYKFCCYLDTLLEASYAEDFIDLVTIGLIGDMMDLRDFETKHLVDKGVSYSAKNPFIESMIKAQDYLISMAGGLSPFSLSFYIVPQINATIRAGTDQEKELLFRSMLDRYGYNNIPSTKRGCKGQMECLSAQVCRNCNNIRNRQNKQRDNGLVFINKLISENNLLSHKVLVVTIPKDKNISRNLTGLMANCLMAEHQRPVFLLNETDLGWEGSARGYEKSKLTNFKDFVNNSGFANYAEGHQSAFGVGFTREGLKSFVDYSDKELADYDFSPYYKVDEVFTSTDIKLSEILDIAKLKTIWGQGIEEPLVAITGVRITKDNITLLSTSKTNLLKIELPNGLTLIKFGSNEEEYHKLYSPLGYVTINVVGRCASNEWNGTVNPQILISDYEIVGKAQYYF